MLASSSKGVFGASGPRHRFKFKGLAFQSRWLEVSATSVGELVKGNATALDEKSFASGIRRGSIQFASAWNLGAFDCRGWTPLRDFRNLSWVLRACSLVAPRRLGEKLLGKSDLSPLGIVSKFHQHGVYPLGLIQFAEPGRNWPLLKFRAGAEILPWSAQIGPRLV